MTVYRQVSTSLVFFIVSQYNPCIAMQFLLLLYCTLRGGMGGVGCVAALYKNEYCLKGGVATEEKS